MSCTYPRRQSFRGQARRRLGRCLRRQRRTGRIEITSEPPATLQCFNWTIFGSPIGFDCDATPTATPTATATPTVTAAGHDDRLARISGVSRNVRLSSGRIVTDTTNIVVVNQSAHTDTIGVYVDVMAPAAGGCTPNGRVLETTVTLAAGAKTAPARSTGPSRCTAPRERTDLAACGPATLQGVACFNALADDDEDPADNRATRNGPRIVAQ